MIKIGSSGHVPSDVPAPELEIDGGDRPEVAPAPTLRALVDQHVSFVFRSLRRLGVEDMSLDDAVQQVWIVVAKRLGDIRPDRERAFLFGIATRVASEVRRSARRRKHVGDDETVAAALDAAPLADERIDQKRARAMLDEILNEMSDDLRAVFVLYELEQATMAEIADALAIAPGTVASRLRRAREVFSKAVQHRRGGGP